MLHFSLRPLWVESSRSPDKSGSYDQHGNPPSSVQHDESNPLLRKRLSFENRWSGWGGSAYHAWRLSLASRLPFCMAEYGFHTRCNFLLFLGWPIIFGSNVSDILRDIYVYHEFPSCLMR